jgi:3-mercaptopyruvate sulfurtransferase SseA
MAVLGLGLILLAGAVFLALRPTAEPAATAGPAQQIPVEEIPRVNLLDAKVAYESGAAVFVDVRDEESYASSHIPGAILIPLGDMPDRAGELDRNAWIITYCT